MVANDDFEDFDDFDDDLDDVPAADGPRRRSGGGSALGEAWRSRPVFRLLVLVTIGGVVATGILMTLPEKKAEDLPSAVKPAPEVTEAPGGGETTPYVEEAIRTASRNRAEAAQAQGRSALPTPQGAEVEVESTSSASEESATDLLSIWRSAEVQPPAPPPPEVLLPEPEQPEALVEEVEIVVEDLGPTPEEIELMTNLMQAQMGAMIEAWEPRPAKSVQVVSSITAPSVSGYGAYGGAGASIAQPYQPSSANPPTIPAGSIYYAQMVTEANSDIPAPILAELVSGPLRGARMIGSFSSTGDYLVINFNRAIFRGKEYSIQGLAMDPNSSLTALATHRDKRYLERIVLPAAAAFVEGMTEALAQTASSNSQTNSSDALVVDSEEPTLEDSAFAGIEEAAGVVTEELQNEASEIEPLVRVEIGTPMQILFLSAVTLE